MPTSPSTDSGQPKISVTVRLDQPLRAWAKSHDLNLSELLAQAIIAHCGPVPTDGQRDRTPAPGPTSEPPPKKDVPF